MRTALVSTALLLAAAGCGSENRPCSPDAECGSEGACIVGRCRPATAAVVAVESRRVVLLAKDVAVLSSGSVPSDARVTAFGSNAAGEVMVLLAFDGDVTREVTIEGAFLVVEPEPASPGPSAPVEIDVLPILAPWQSANVSWGRTPTLGLPIGSGRVPPSRRAPLRIDVTEAVASKRGVGYGLALRASGEDPIGARLVTLARSTNGPKLELYLTGPVLPPAKSSASAAASAGASAAPSSGPSAGPSASAGGLGGGAPRGKDGPGKPP